KAQDFSNVEESWKDLDLIAYTSTLKIGQRSSNAPITEEGLFQWLLNAKCECLPRELQNRGIFPDICSIIRNKDILTVLLWVAYMLEKFHSYHLLGWRMVNFLRKAGMVISIIELISKPKDNMISLSQTVKVSSSIIKAEEIADISNATIHHIVDYYEILPESLTEDFILKYGNFNHMKWFRAYRQLRDAGIDNVTVVDAIT
ncbi:10995_t:CDS:2, partial [Funneliformis geosporum]